MSLSDQQEVLESHFQFWAHWPLVPPGGKNAQIFCQINNKNTVTGSFSVHFRQKIRDIIRI